MTSSAPLAPYVLDRETGVPDLWWPYGPQVGRYSFKTTAEQTGGRMAQLLAREHRGAAVPLHTHLDSDETFYVISGTLDFVVGNGRAQAQAGDYVFGPMGIPHAWMVTSDTAEVLITVCGAGTAGPEGTGIEGFFREVAPEVADWATVPEPAMPDERQFAERMAVYGITLDGPPPFQLS